MGRYPQGAASIGQALDLLREVGDRPGQARARANLGEVALRQDRYQEAARHLYEALAMLREVGDRTSEADTLVSLGVINLRQGRFTQASKHLRQALALLREAGDLSRQAMALNSMGELFLATGQPDLPADPPIPRPPARTRTARSGVCSANENPASSYSTYKHQARQGHRLEPRLGHHLTSPGPGGRAMRAAECRIKGWA